MCAFLLILPHLVLFLFTYCPKVVAKRRKGSRWKKQGFILLIYRWSYITGHVAQSEGQFLISTQVPKSYNVRSTDKIFHKYPTEFLKLLSKCSKKTNIIIESKNNYPSDYVIEYFTTFSLINRIQFLTLKIAFL